VAIRNEMGEIDAGVGTSARAAGAARTDTGLVRVTEIVDFRSWLASLGLEHCYKKFVCAGFNDLELLAHLTEADLDAIQIGKPHERLILIDAAKELQDPALWPDGCLAGRHHLLPEHPDAPQSSPADVHKGLDQDWQHAVGSRVHEQKGGMQRPTLERSHSW
jgi:hypothetical protein